MQLSHNSKIPEACSESAIHFSQQMFIGIYCVKHSVRSCLYRNNKQKGLKEKKEYLYETLPQQ